MSPGLFALAHLVLCVVFLAWVGIAGRRDRRTFYTRRRGIRYRRLSSEELLKQLERRK